MAPKVSLGTDQSPPFSRTHSGRRSGVSLRWGDHTDQDSTAHRKIVRVPFAGLEPWPGYSLSSRDLEPAASLTG